MKPKKRRGENMFCGTCGTKLEDGSKFCGKCGMKQSAIDCSDIHTVPPAADEMVASETGNESKSTTHEHTITNVFDHHCKGNIPALVVRDSCFRVCKNVFPWFIAIRVFWIYC